MTCANFFRMKNKTLAQGRQCFAPGDQAFEKMARMTA